MRQVLPYIYTHLVSFGVAFYLVSLAFLKGLFFTPGASFAFGFVLPLVSLLLIVSTFLGLLSIGQ